MKTNISKEHVSKIGFWQLHSLTIERLTRLTESLFKQLQAEGYITHYEQTRELKFEVADSIFRLFYTCRVPYTDAFTYDFRMRYALGQSGRKIKEVDSSRLATFLIDANASEYSIYQMLTNCINGWKKGVTNEHAFNNFLVQIATKYSDRILQTFAASQRSDMQEGIDFVVRYLSRPEYEQIEVSFNLKSSSTFIEQHKKQYPAVSTFIFSASQLKDFGRLERRLLKFILAAAKSVVHY